MEPLVATPTLEPQRHPRGLSTLFFTEMWERCSYYGMRALLVLFMVDSARGGLGLSDEVATAIYGLYTAGVYLAALPGGWVADRLVGARRAVWVGGCIIAAGHFTLAVPNTHAFYLGLILVIVGTGLLKPNISAIVGQLYPEGGARRDAGFTIFYMGINLGAALGPLVCSYLGEKHNWHYGFAAAGVGMVLGLIQYGLMSSRLGPAGMMSAAAESNTKAWRLFLVAVTGLVMVVALVMARVIPFDPVVVARSTTSIIVGLALVYFAVLFIRTDLSVVEKKRIGVIAVLFVSSAMFWSGFEQAGSSLNLFAERYTLRQFARFGSEIPAGWFQSLNPLYIITLAPVVAATWLALARRQREPSLPVKFALGLLLLAGGFLVMVAAARVVAGGAKAWPTWLITTYFLHSVGELCLSPVGLSSVTKLAPARLTGQMMGVWFLATSLGNLIAGLVAGEFSADAVERMPARYGQIVLTTGATAIALLLLRKPIKKLMAGVR